MSPKGRPEGEYRNAQHEGGPVVADRRVTPDFMHEWLTDETGFWIRSAGELEHFRSKYQEVEVHDTRAFGKLFRLDGYFMTSEWDEFFYHENLVHPAAVTHPAPQRALVIGGGDAGSSEELLKHPTMGSVTLVELDQAVIDIARRHFQSVHRGAFDDPRLTLHVADGLAYVRESTERFDLVVLDLTDPGGPSEPLYTADFYRACAKRLSPGGALTLHIASPVAHPERIRAGLARLREAFRVVVPYLTTIPLYGGLWMMACASDTLDPRTLSAAEADRRVRERGLADLQYYNGEMHAAALALPNFVRRLVG